MSTKKMVMIPGPTPVVESIRQEMGRPIQAFGDPRFVADYKKLIDDLGRIFNCSGMTFPLAGTGTLAMEMAMANRSVCHHRELGSYSAPPKVRQLGSGPSMYTGI